MRNFNRLALVWWPLTALLCAVAVQAQTLKQVPELLSTVPISATVTDPYWQHLVIDLSERPSFHNTIEIRLPDGMTVADTDSNGSFDDEISLDAETGKDTGYDSVVGSTANTLLLQVSNAGGVIGPVHVQFPVAVTATATGKFDYGAVTFSNENEDLISAGTVAVTYVSTPPPPDRRIHACFQRHRRRYQPA